MPAKFLIVGFLVLFGSCARNACANGYEFDLKQIGRIDPKREVPSFKIIRRPEPSRTLKRWRYDSVLLRFRDERLLRLGGKSIWLERSSQSEREAGVIEETVKAGWLADTEDLLLIAWTDNSGSFGTAHSEYRGTMVVRHTKESTVSLLRYRSLTGASTRHIGYPGLTYHYYDFDAKRELLIDRISQRTTLKSEFHKPLHHPMKDPHGKEIFNAEIRQFVFRRYKYRNGTLKSRSIQLYYQSQERDTLLDIARFYLGPLAPANAILRANTHLRHRGFVGSGACINLPKGIRVRIPVPKQWLVELFAPDSS